MDERVYTVFIENIFLKIVIDTEKYNNNTCGGVQKKNYHYSSVS